MEQTRTSSKVATGLQTRPRVRALAGDRFIVEYLTACEGVRIPRQSQTGTQTERGHRIHSLGVIGITLRIRIVNSPLITAPNGPSGTLAVSLRKLRTVCGGRPLTAHEKGRESIRRHEKTPDPIWR